MNELIDLLILITKVGTGTLFVYLWVVLFMYVMKKTVQFFRDNDDNWPHGGATGGA